MTVLASLLAGLVFGLGLIVSGMVDPAKVLGFLDLWGSWDPSLALVMAGAIAVGGIALGVANKRTTSFLGAQMRLPASRDIDTGCWREAPCSALAGASPASARARVS